MTDADDSGAQRLSRASILPEERTDEDSGRRSYCSYRAFRAPQCVNLLRNLQGEDSSGSTPGIGVTSCSGKTLCWTAQFSGYFLHSCAPNVSVDMQSMKVIAA